MLIYWRVIAYISVSGFKACRSKVPNSTIVDDCSAQRNYHKKQWNGFNHQAMSQSEPLKIPRFPISWNTSWLKGFPILWVITIPSKSGRIKSPFSQSINQGIFNGSSGFTFNDGGLTLWYTDISEGNHLGRCILTFKNDRPGKHPFNTDRSLPGLVN